VRQARSASNERRSWLPRSDRRADLNAVAFLGVIVFAELSPAFPHDPAPKVGWWIGGVAATLAAAAVHIVARAHPAGRWVKYLPLLLFLAAVQMLRAADGDGVSGFAPLLVLPVVWYALYGSRLAVLLALAGTAAVLFGPLIVVGGPRYPVTLWRSGFLWITILSLIGLAAQQLVVAIRSKSAALASSEARFRTAFSNAPTGVALVGAAGAQLGVYLQVNRALAALLGRSEDDVVNRSVLEFTHPDDRTLTEQHLLSPPERRVGQIIEKRYLHSSGRAVPVKITYSQVNTDPSSGPYVVAHIEDITARRDAQLQMLEGLLRDIEHNADRLSDPVDIEAVVRAAIESIRPIARGREVALQVDISLAGAQVSGEAAKIDRVLMNILDNAVKFTPPGGAIDAQARVRGHAVVIDVTDTGIGIRRDEQDRIFDRFYRTREVAQRSIPGTGLGLTIAKAISEQHHGTIRVFSEPGAGSTFTFTLPLREHALA
jgi:PAS domain S-box-containing protein